MTAAAPLSVLIPVKNDAANLRECLRSVAFADEIVVGNPVRELRARAPGRQL